MSDSVLLPTGRTISLDEIELGDDNQTFYYGDFDVTGYLTVDQKNSFPDYDSNAVADKAYVANYEKTHGGAAPPAVGSTSLLSNFVSGFQVANPINDALNGLGKGILKAIPVWIWLLLALALFLYLGGGDLVKRKIAKA